MTPAEFVAALNGYAERKKRARLEALRRVSALVYGFRDRRPSMDQIRTQITGEHCQVVDFEITPSLLQILKESRERVKRDKDARVTRSDVREARNSIFRRRPEEDGRQAEEHREDDDRFREKDDTGHHGSAGGSGHGRSGDGGKT